MDRYIMDGIEYIGINKELPENSKYFSELEFWEVFSINSKTELRNILSISLDTKVDDINIIDNIKGEGNDGRRLLGKKLVFNITFYIKLKYVSAGFGSVINICEFSCNKFCDISVPSEIAGRKIEDLKRRKTIKIGVYTENLEASILAEKDFKLLISNIVNLEVLE